MFKRIIWVVWVFLFINFNLYAGTYYIDYEKGNDNNVGTKEAPFKHHPWDKNAIGKSLETKGVNTYYFKKGIIYRGNLVAQEYGEKDNPIILTTDKNWGTGEACIYGSERMTGGWKRCTDADTEILKEVRNKIWYIDLDKSYLPTSVYEIRDNKIIPINLARTPNWKISNPDDPKSEWWEWTGNKQDTVHLTQKEKDYWKGGVVWTEQHYITLPTPFAISGYDPVKQELKFNYNIDKSIKYYRYFIENHPNCLDDVNEFYYNKNTGRLYIRLQDDKNPNKSIVEIAKTVSFITLEKKKYINIDGLTIRFFNALEKNSISEELQLIQSAIVLKGSNQNIKITNCIFEYVPDGIAGFPFENNDLIDNIEITNNTLNNIFGNAIVLNMKINKRIIYSKSRIKHILIKGNKIYNCEFRNSFFSCGAIVVGFGEMIEVSYNEIDTCYTNGINICSGADYEGDEYNSTALEYPLMRTLIHHNKVVNSVLGVQDNGGIETFYLGPFYIYNNISGNAVGYKNAHSRTAEYKASPIIQSCFGPAMYLDGGTYKAYVFNNILWGKNNNINDPIYNSIGLEECHAFLKTIFNNTMYNFVAGLTRGGMNQYSRSYYLNNLFLNISYKFIEQMADKDSNLEVDSLAYAGNVFHGAPKRFGSLGVVLSKKIANWKSYLEYKKAITSDTGIETNEEQVKNMKNHDFNPKKDSLLIDKAHKVFVPWGLYSVVGEWGFYKHKADPKIIIDEHVYWNKDLRGRWDLPCKMPRNDLIGYNIDETNYKQGLLENWVEGALDFNGVNQYCELKDNPVHSADMDTNSFLIEAVVNGKKGCIVSKILDNKGYLLGVDENGKLKMNLFSDKGEYYCESGKKINDGNWHHIIAEVDRKNNEINIYIDGKKSSEKVVKIIEGSLSNKGNLYVGKGTVPLDGYFSGMIDFLRISRGTLEDAETTIEELYKWEFDGPFLRDFYDKPATGKARDVGAIEYSE